MMNVSHCMMWSVVMMEMMSAKLTQMCFKSVILAEMLIIMELMQACRQAVPVAVMLACSQAQTQVAYSFLIGMLLGVKVTSHLLSFLFHMSLSFLMPLFIFMRSYSVHHLFIFVIVESFM